MMLETDIFLPRVKKEATKGNSACYTIGPIDAGYACSLASGLRRVLLSSLPGAAITSVQIEGVQHEFQDIPNVKEDVTDIVQNLKKVRLRSYADRPVTVYLDVRGERIVTAGDIKIPGTIEIVNPDLPIATLDNEQAHLDMELVVETGRGFVAASTQAEQKARQQPIGVILVDAIYSPVIHVNFIIEAVQRGRLENFDQIELEITTDGTISPDEALRIAADILRQQFFVVATQEYVTDKPKKPVHLSTVRIPKSIYHMDIAELQLSLRVYNALKRCGITQVGYLLTMDERELMLIRNVGEKSFQELVERLRVKGCLPKTRPITNESQDAQQT